MQTALLFAVRINSEFLTPEHLLYAATDAPVFIRAVKMLGGDVVSLRDSLDGYISGYVPQRRDEGEDKRSIDERVSDGFASAMETAIGLAESMGAPEIALHHLIYGISRLNESYAVHYLKLEVGDLNDFISTLQLLEEGGPDEGDWDEEEGAESYVLEYARLLNDEVADHNPLIGRDKELDRIIRILLRKEKNNPLLIGEPGVGKTSVVYGLADRINRGDVPDALKNAKVYSLDMGEIVAGTQYRGDFEKRLMDICDALEELDDPIVFIDEIHNMIGAGAQGPGSMDASNLLKPYLDGGRIRFIGATTYEEYKRYFAKNSTVTRRFRNVDIKEPEEEEATRILEGLKSSYERFHGIKYGRGVLRDAVVLSKAYMGGRYLPDKAIDLIDEAGAYRRMHPIEGKKTQQVGKDVIETVLSESGRIPKHSTGDDGAEELKGLYGRISSRVFGQDEAVRRIVDSICMSRAGLVGKDKPIASFLFVGPTGVGKTEVAKVLAKELNIEFVRFDMSEYAEKHTVSKLIGSPAGYVGYEDGGLLTDAIRKTPHCVLLLDEIEKAHPDIYNVLLQMMDYAQLTDNRGQKADFKNVVIIMTSNAGARLIGRQSIGFGAAAFNDSIMMEEVKRVFPPEFRNRLSAIVGFNHMSAEMAGQITRKKLGELEELLADKKIKLEVEKEAHDYIRTKGITREYGARQIERVIDSEIKPLLVSEILFGALKNGGRAVLYLKDGKPAVRTAKKAAEGRRRVSAGNDKERLTVKLIHNKINE